MRCFREHGLMRHGVEKGYNVNMERVRRHICMAIWLCFLVPGRAGGDFHHRFTLGINLFHAQNPYSLPVEFLNGLPETVSVGEFFATYTLLYRGVRLDMYTTCKGQVSKYLNLSPVWIRGGGEAGAKIRLWRETLYLNVISFGQHASVFSPLPTDVPYTLWGYAASTVFAPSLVFHLETGAGQAFNWPDTTAIESSSTLAFLQVTLAASENVTLGATYTFNNTRFSPEVIQNYGFYSSSSSLHLFTGKLSLETNSRVVINVKGSYGFQKGGLYSREHKGIGEFNLWYYLSSFAVKAFASFSRGVPQNRSAYYSVFAGATVTFSLLL